MESISFHPDRSSSNIYITETLCINSMTIYDMHMWLQKGRRVIFFFLEAVWRLSFKGKLHFRFRWIYSASHGNSQLTHLRHFNNSNFLLKHNISLLQCSLHSKGHTLLIKMTSQISKTHLHKIPTHFHRNVSMWMCKRSLLLHWECHEYMPESITMLSGWSS